MEVEILFKETIKPCSSTPEHRKSYKLSLLDQLAPPVYIPIISFYSSTPDQTPLTKSGRLKKSLSETLTAFYPLAGRIKNIFSIDCNDEGALYVEAHVAGKMSMILQDPEISQLEKLLPFDPHDQISSNQVILAIQVNHFDCGGMAISICIWHAIADASAAAAFATSWAAVASGAATHIDGIICDCTSIFPPQDIQSFSLHRYVKKELMSNIIMKRFVFDHSKLAALREEVGNGCLSHPSRVETVAAVIWSTVLGLTGEEDEDTVLNSAAIAVNLRKRMNPALPQLSLGNIYQVAMANCSKNENRVDYKGLVGKIHDSVAIMKDEYVRKIHEGGRYFEFMKKRREETEKTSNVMNVFGFSSWCKFPFYEADFGWGKPIWVTTALKLYKVAIFIDTKDGEGIEAWVALPKGDMPKFEQNPDICSYASFMPTT